nr:shieldin complex subunit 1 isoform X3 [Anas platyrhynchos]
MPVPHTFHCACNVLWMPSASYICAGATKSICVGSSCHRLRVVRSELRLTNHQEGGDTEAVTSSLLLAPVPGDCSNISAIPSGPMEGKEPSPSLHSEESSVLDLPSVSVCDLAEIFQPSSSTESSEEPFRSPDSFPSPLPVCASLGDVYLTCPAPGLAAPAEKLYLLLHPVERQRFASCPVFEHVCADSLCKQHVPEHHVLKYGCLLSLSECRRKQSTLCSSCWSL